MTSVLITGGNGLVGSHLADALLRSGFEVTLMDRNFGQNTLEIDAPKLQGDICEPSFFQTLGLRPDVVFHAAAMSRVAWGEADPFKCMAINVGGLTNLLEWASNFAKSPFFISVSSREVYGECDHRPVREDHEKRPKSAYGISKLTGERLIEYYSRTRRMQASIVRLSNVYGSLRDLKERVIPRFVASAVAGTPLTLNGGKQVLDFTHISDTVNGLASIIKRVDSKDLSAIQTDFHFTTSVGHSVEDLAALIVRLSHSESEVRRVGAIPTDVEWFVGDYSKARNILGYQPQTSLESGLDRYIREVRAAA